MSLNEKNASQEHIAPVIVDDGGLAYKDMNDVYYYVGTIFYYGLAVFGSCVIPAVDEIFEFIGTICVNCIGFIFPAIFYLSASRRYYRKREGLLSAHNNENTLD